MVMLRRKNWRDILENKGVYFACVVVISLGLLLYSAMSIVKGVYVNVKTI